jgi:uncharacterized protein (TIGR02466 family)
MAMHTELWFPQVIWSAIIHMIDNYELKNWAYERKKNDIGRRVSNFGGYQSDDIQQGVNPQVDKLVSHLNQEVKTLVTQVSLPQLELKNIWLNINPPGSYNELHTHADSVLSGVYYIDADSNLNQGNIQFERSDNAEYHLPQHIEKINYFNSTRATYAAKTGALYIFPSWLKHSVQGNQSNKDRISMSFNFGEKNEN